MRAISLPSYRLVPARILIVALAVGLVIGLALLVFGGVLSASPLDHTPDGQLLGPFRWVPESSAA